MTYGRKDLAIYGGPKAKTTPNLPMFPGGLEIGAEEKKEVMEVLDNKYLFRYYGPKDSPSKVKALEEQYAKYLGTKHCLALNSCTSALISALVAVGVGPGDEVIVPSYTFFATCAAVVAARAIPIVAEVDRSLTMDPADFEQKISPRTKAVIPVHMRGMPAKMDRIMEIAKKHSLKVIEDVAQANGGTFHGKPLGSFGDVGCFSLQFHKIITSGEGGILATNGDLAVHARAGLSRRGRLLAQGPLRPARVRGRDLLRRELPHERAHRRRCACAVPEAGEHRVPHAPQQEAHQGPHQGSQGPGVPRGDRRGGGHRHLHRVLPSEGGAGGGVRQGAAGGGRGGGRHLQQGRAGLAHVPALEDAHGKDDAHGEGLPVQLPA